MYSKGCISALSRRQHEFESRRGRQSETSTKINSFEIILSPGFKATVSDRFLCDIM